MDDYSINLKNLNSADQEKQLAGLAFFAACNEKMLNNETVDRLVYLAENAPRHISNVAASIISQSLSNRQHNFIAAPLLHKLQHGKESEISLHELEWATKLNLPAFKQVLEEYLDRCTEVKHISWLVKNLPRAYPDPQQIPVLTSFLTYGDERVVSNAIEGLECIKDPTVISIFAQMIGHASSRVKSMAAEALSRANPEKAYNALAIMLQHPENKEVIKAACFAIRQMKGRDFTELLLPLLHYDATQEEAASTIAVILLEKTTVLFEHKELLSRENLKSIISSAMIANLQNYCQQK